MTSTSVVFHLNGRPVEVRNPDPGLMLVDFLRSPEVGLTGVKKGCGQGGCGSCTVILSRWDAQQQRMEHRAVNSCLRPLCSLGGLCVTTIEGLGAPVKPPPEQMMHSHVYGGRRAPLDFVAPSERIAMKKARDVRVTYAAAPLEATSCATCAGMNPVAFELAMNNGTQCGYCSTGFVMAMSAFLAENAAPEIEEIERLFDGHLCRCTGYRPILTAMKTFASKPPGGAMRCRAESGCENHVVPRTISVPTPDTARISPVPVDTSRGKPLWKTPTTMAALSALWKRHGGKACRLVHGNTSYGIYPGEFRNAKVLLDLRLLPELKGISISPTHLEFGAATTFSELIHVLQSSVPGRFESLLHMARRTAGTLVRNAATVGGNTMLALHHVHAGEMFTSDSLTALVAADAVVDVVHLSTGKPETMPIASLLDLKAAHDLLLLRYHVPATREGEIELAQKTALREVNAHALVNLATRFALDASLSARSVKIVLGGIAPRPWRPRLTEAMLAGTVLDVARFPSIAAQLLEEITTERAIWKKRLALNACDGIDVTYRAGVACSLLYKAMLHAMESVAPGTVPAGLKSAAKSYWGTWPVSEGKQVWQPEHGRSPLHEPYVKLSAFYQTSGKTRYTQELPVPKGTLNAAFVLSRSSLGCFHFVLPGSGGARTDVATLAKDLLARFAGFRRLITKDDLPAGGVNLQGMGGDQPLLADKRVLYAGQAIALVVADTEQDAIRIADFVSDSCIAFEPIDWPPEWSKPILTIEQAMAQKSIFPDNPVTADWMSHIWRIIRPGSHFEWTHPEEAKPDGLLSITKNVVDQQPCLVLENAQHTGGQAHFYMETQGALVEPTGDDRLVVHPAAQDPAAIHSAVASALHMRHIEIEVMIPHVGGAFGGKMETARFIAAPVALAARILNRPVRLAMPRDADSLMTGKRHPYFGRVQIAVDDGSSNKADRGIIRGLDASLWGDGGAYYDCSFIVSDCMQLRSDNAYNIKNYRTRIDVCRTNTAPNTAFRAFGFIQSNLILENAVEDAAVSLGMDPADLREKNLYRRGDTTPAGQKLEHCYLEEVWTFARKQSGYDALRKSVTAFNAENRWRKRGLCLLPLKYGTGYNLAMLEHASTLVAVYPADGSVIIHQGGVEMGQGLLTMIEQIAAHELNIPIQMIRVERPRTAIITNPIATGASTGTAYNGEAVRQACRELRKRLEDFGDLLKTRGEAWCREARVDFWNQGAAGWSATYDVPDSDVDRLYWQNLVQHADWDRLNLSVQFRARIRGGEAPVSAMEFKPASLQKELKLPGIRRKDPEKDPSGFLNEFVDFTYSAACSVVELDVLTGESKILSSDIVYDVGRSLNPAIDVGQVEGAFVQGIGYVLTERLVFEQGGRDKGRLNTVNTWQYKPPAAASIPLKFNVTLFPRDEAANVPENSNNLYSSKEVGEPPLVLANSVFFALKDAIRASRRERNLDALFPLDAPATVDRVYAACAVTNDQLGGTI